MMRQVRILTIILPLLVWFTHIGAGTSGSLVGVVKDANTREPLMGVFILLDNSILGTQSAEDGTFFIHNIPAGEHTVVAEIISYKKKIIKGVVISPDFKTKLEIFLDPDALTGETVVIEAEMPVVRKDITASQYVVERKEIEVLPVTTVGQILETRAGVVEGGHIRGGRSEEVIYLIDGIPLNQSISGGLGSYLPMEAVQEMTVLTGGWDPEFGNASSGVVNIVTRRPSPQTEASIKYENDHLFGGNRDDRYQRLALSFSAPLWKNRLSFFGVGVLQRDDTRFWWDFEENFKKPLHHQYSFLGNLNWEAAQQVKLGLQLLYSDEATQEYDYAWRYNLQGLPSTGRRSLRSVLHYSHNLSSKSYIDAKLSFYRISDKMNDLEKDELDRLEPYDYDVFLLYIIRGDRIWWKRATENITTIRSRLTTFEFMDQYVRLGFDFNYFDINQDLVKFEPQRSIWGKPLVDEPLLNYSNFFHYQPYNGAAFIQAKWETPQGSQVNIGVRYDFLNPRARAPLIAIPGSQAEFSEDSIRWSKASIKHQFSPRVGFGMPVLENSYLFINYGVFFQTPLFEHFYTGLNSDFRFSQRALIGNPDIPPMKSKIFEISYRHIVAQDYAVILTGSVKKTTNLVDVSTFIGYDSKLDKNRGYGQFVTSPFAEAQTFEVVLRKRPKGFLWGELNYTYSVAKAVSDQDNANFEYLQWGFSPDYDLYYVSWDQRHTVNLNLNFKYKNLINASVISRFATPRPYTYFPSRSRNGLVPQDSNQRLTPNNKRMEETYSTDLKMQLNLSAALKSWVKTPGQLSLFADIRNLFNRKNVLWISADGRIGGELNDPAAYSVGQRIRLGLEYVY
ncbi:MAG: hypothetical protein Kow0042_10080 [Calditrichia bacterium]